MGEMSRGEKKKKKAAAALDYPWSTNEIPYYHI